MNKFAWLFCGCILALSACSERQLGPDSGTTDGPEIRFGVSEQGSGTKALIEANGLTATGSKAQLHVFDILTGFNGTVNGQSPDAQTGELTYIDKTIGYVGSAWPFVDATSGAAETPAYYRWTKTGTHTFFGYLTKDPAGNTFTGATMNGKVLSISERALTPATTPQFDFLYSDIISRDAATGPYTAIPLSMKHLFTAIAVDIVNETNTEITNLSVTFTKVHPTQSATVDWGTPLAADSQGKIYPTVTYTPKLADQTATNAADMLIGTLDSVPVSTKQKPVTVHFFDGEYRVLWPQKILAPVEATGTTEAVPGSGVSVTYTGCTGARIANLSDLKDANDNPITTFEAGKKYLLTITIKPYEVRFNIQVVDLVNRNDPDKPSGNYNGEAFYVES